MTPEHLFLDLNFRSCQFIAILIGRGRSLLTITATRVATARGTTAVHVAAAERIANLRQEPDFLADLCFLSVEALPLRHALVELVHWENERQIDCGCNEEESDQSGEHGAGLNRCVTNMELAYVVKVGFSKQPSDSRVNHLANKVVDDWAEGIGNDDSDGEFDDIAAHDEFLETLYHGESISFF